MRRLYRLTEARIDRAWIVAVDFAQTPAQRAQFGVLRLSLRPGPVLIRPTLKAANRRGRSPRASTALFKMFAALQQGQSIVLSDQRTASMCYLCRNPCQYFFQCNSLHGKDIVLVSLSYSILHPISTQTAFSNSNRRLSLAANCLR